MEGVREIMTQKVPTKYLPAQAGLKETIVVQREYMRTVRIFFLFGNISEQFGYERVRRYWQIRRK